LSVKSFSPNTTYHFVVTNTGKTAHEFMIMPKLSSTLYIFSKGDRCQLPRGNVSAGLSRCLCVRQKAECFSASRLFQHQAGAGDVEKGELVHLLPSGWLPTSLKRLFSTEERLRALVSEGKKCTKSS
jgi:hypothetical protein